MYLTNALETAQDFSQGAFDFAIPALAHEARAVNKVKGDQRFTVVIGNPPYSGHSANKGEWIRELLRGSAGTLRVENYFEVDGGPLNERNPKWLNDDYVKFIRLAHWQIERTGLGLLGFITNHSYLDNLTFRGMRESLAATFPRAHLLDLHGNAKKKERVPDGGKDENVFDIQQGVAIGLFMCPQVGTVPIRPTYNHADVWGVREQTGGAGKYDRLVASDVANTEWHALSLKAPLRLFVPRDERLNDEYEAGWKITDIFLIYGVGMTTARDHVVIDFAREPLIERASLFRNSKDSDEYLCAELGIPLKKGWSVSRARKLIQEEEDLESLIEPVLYRPFDERLILYHDSLVWRTVKRVMRHMLAGENVGLIFMRQVAMGDEYTHFGASRHPVDNRAFYSNKGIMSFGPLYLYPGVGKADGSLFSRWPKGKGGRTPNLDLGFVEQLAAATELRFVSDGRGDLGKTFGPEDVVAYIYAVFHSPGYRERYEALLKLDFPRVPLPESVDLFRRLVEAGHDLLALHLLESPKLGKPITSYAGPRNPEVGRVGWSDGTVWLDAGKTSAREGHRATMPGTMGFQGVPVEVWDFHIGGYQFCHKWLKDRKGRTLSDEDVAHYQKIVVALNETIRIMAEIEEVIEAHGGWPDAFSRAYTLRPV